MSERMHGLLIRMRKEIVRINHLMFVGFPLLLEMLDCPAYLHGYQRLFSSFLARFAMMIVLTSNFADLVADEPSTCE